MARSHDMTSGSIWQNLLRFAIPIMISNLVQSTYNAVDMLFVGQFTGTESLAAVSVCGPIMNVMIITLSGMSAGVLVVVSGLLGAGDLKQAQEAAHTSIALYTLMAVVTTVLGILFVPQILAIVQTPEAAMQEAKRYLYTMFTGTVFSFGYNLIGALQRGLGNAVASMSFVIVSSVANILLDAVFIIGLDMGAFGAALGTVLSQVAAFVIGAVQFAKGATALRISLREVRFHGKHLKNILLFGVPTALNEVMVNTAMLTVSGVANSFGLASSAAYGVSSRIDSLAIFTDSAMHQTMSAYASQNVGAGKNKRALSGLWRAILLSASIAFCTAMLVLTFARQFAACFDSNPEVVEQSVALLRVTVWSYPLFATVGPLIGFIRGTGNLEASLLVGVVAQLCCRIPASFLFARLMGFPGVGVAVLIGPLVSVSIYVWYILSGRWHKGVARVARL
ncbi:MATE family efflux transporter [uncultured Ruthenibacterium sp.]|uniref:MATE family efflux transporter n=1 Tax=uncultured Ruthenibacterium sp. TaxID=1905347 RepID=UPI00349EE603